MNIGVYGIVQQGPATVDSLYEADDDDVYSIYPARSVFDFVNLHIKSPPTVQHEVENVGNCKSITALYNKL